VLVSGAAGTGKSSLAAAFSDAACRRGERCLYLAFEESPGQIIRNMASIGFDLDPWVGKKLLFFHAARPTVFGLEQHLVMIHNLADKIRPAVVVMDPVTNLSSIGETAEITSMLTRVIDYLKMQGITALFTSLTPGGSPTDEQTDVGISSLMDTWLLLRNAETGGSRKRLLQILKSRGMAHSSQVCEFELGDRGISLITAESTGKRNFS
jgi:circadian clock protein KaiC